ncbi:MAG: hypothetical protein QOF77_829 [Solirubrobacteraceae bacterium]|jgi:hypothetical protein|nr:hypothetical protein [Solirubrobacteraceae bacterium]
MSILTVVTGLISHVISLLPVGSLGGLGFLGL